MKANLKSVYDGLATTRGNTQIHLQDVQPMGNGHFKVVAAVTGIDTEAKFAEAIAAETEGAARLVRGSTVARGRIVVGVLASNVRSKPLDGGFKLVTACTASDASGNIWNVVNDGSGKRVLIESADDLESMLRDRMAHRKVVANPLEGAGVATASWDNGDLVRYVDTRKGTVQCALAFRVDGEVRGVTTGGKTRRISAASIVEAVTASQVGDDVIRVQRECAGTDLTGAELEKVIGYLMKCGTLSDAMAAKMRALSNTPPAGGQA